MELTCNSDAEEISVVLLDELDEVEGVDERLVRQGVRVGRVLGVSRRIWNNRGTEVVRSYQSLGNGEEKFHHLL